MRIQVADRAPSRTSMQLSWAQLQRLADDFDLGRVIQMDVPTTTQCNTTDPFRTGQGTFMLRARHGEEFVERVEYLHRVIDFLHGQGFPVPRVIRSRQGKGCSVWGDRIVEVHSFIPHDPGSHRDWTRMLAAASTLGELHNLLHEVQEQNWPPVAPEMRNDATPAQCVALLQEGQDNLAGMEEEYREAPRAMNLARQASELFEQLDHDYSRTIGQLPWGIVHGDYHFWNLLYRADQVVGVVDFDFLQERERLFDIAYALQNTINYLWRFRAKKSVEFPSLSWDNVRHWLDCYDSTAHEPLRKEERRQLPIELLRIFLVGITTAAFQSNPVRQMLNIGEMLPLYQWIAGQKNLFTHAGQ